MINETHCDEFAERLADLLERDVDETTRAALESHALGCADCGALLADMRRLRIDASSLPVLAPSRDLWDGISRRIDAPIIPLRSGDRDYAHDITRWRRWAPMAAAALLLIAVTATSTYYLTTHGRAAVDTSVAVREQPALTDTARRVAVSSEPRAPTAVATTRAGSTTDRVRQLKQIERAPAAAGVPGARLASTKPSAEQVYLSEITRLHVIVERRRSQLDPVTVSVIERNLKVIDDAIAQCKLALVKDPASRFLMESLNNAFENKVELLRTATMLPARS
jgi:hypothetical protein